MSSAPTVRAPAADPARLARLAAFTSAAGAEAFHSIVGPREVWRADPFDVESIHDEARQAFERLLNRAAQNPPPDKGRVLLLRGEAGSGKTHLMRAFRHRAHSTGRGYCGYMQMTAATTNYARYVLRNVISTLDDPYLDPDTPTPGMLRLSNGLAESLPEAERQRLRECELGELYDLVPRLADDVVSRPKFSECNLDLIRALLFLQREDPRIKNRVFSYLRCEDLSRADREMLGDLVPRCHEEDPPFVLAQLGKLIHAVHGAALVLLVDQLEDIFNLEEEGTKQFRLAIDTLTALGEAVPTSVVVISCLDDFYVAKRQHLVKPKLDRLEIDPSPVRLNSSRPGDEVIAVVRRRLQSLYDEEEIPSAQLPDIFPFTEEDLRPLSNLGTRDILNSCLQHQARCALDGVWVSPMWGKSRQGTQPKPPVPPLPLSDTALEQVWNTFQTSKKFIVPDGEEKLAALLGWAAVRCGEELATGHWVEASPAGRTVEIETHAPDNSVAKLLAAVCERQAPGGGLGNQITEAERRAGGERLAIVRSSAFPTSAKAAVSIQLAKILARGGKRIHVTDSEWRRLVALREFVQDHGNRPDFGAWRKQFQPLGQMPALRALLSLDQLSKVAPSQAFAPPPVPPPPTPQPAAPLVPATGALLLGSRLGVRGGDVTLGPDELTMHAAFLGAPGSGKTTAALNLIEQLLLRGTPAILIDRKGDLCRYADPAAWAGATDEQRRLRDRLDVHLYTPGHASGRPLRLPLLPDNMDSLPGSDRELIFGYAAAALGGMMGYRSRVEMTRQAILRKAIEVMASAPGLSPTLATLRSLVDQRDPDLLAAAGSYEDKHYGKLAEELLTLQHNQGSLLEQGERLDFDDLLGRGPKAQLGRTRLSVISTRFLSEARFEFWVAQFLIALGRWVARRPTPSLQAVALFDEADKYLPAVRQPATKAPMEDLLRRGRSGGFGVLLATQSPGDLDYRCRDQIKTWLVGRIREDVALRKLEAESLPQIKSQGQGEFYLLREKEQTALKSRPSLLRTEQLPEERILELAKAQR